MEKVRKPFQGVLNIVRFNWHFYLLSFGFMILLLLLEISLPAYETVLFLLAFGILAISIVSLSVSWYVYDLSNLYSFQWLNSSSGDQRVVNITAGFDETSNLLSNRFPQAEILVLDFYDPSKHTEISIKRARKAYPAFPGTQQITTANLNRQDHSFDKIFLILSAHEIRNEEERIGFFKELNRVLTPRGEILVVEHLRDIPNLLAYNIGFFHFHSKSTWLKTFRAAQLDVKQEIKITPFISTFTLKKHGNTL